MDIRDKIAVIAGGGGSLGSVITASLAQRGARVVVLDAAPVAPETLPDGGFAIQADAADEDAVAAAIRAIVERAGKISALINCTGLIHSEPLINLMDPVSRRHRLDTWNATIRSNLTATFVLGAHVAESMAATRTKGVIINFSSIAAAGNPGQSAYAASKAGIESMTTVWARELGPLGIRAVAIAPGFVGTPSTAAAMSESALAELKRRTPMMRLAKPLEIASAVEFAIQNDFLTGTTIAVDGGLVL